MLDGWSRVSTVYGTDVIICNSRIWNVNAVNYTFAYITDAAVNNEHAIAPIIYLKNHEDFVNSLSLLKTATNFHIVLKHTPIVFLFDLVLGPAVIFVTNMLRHCFSYVGTIHYHKVVHALRRFKSPSTRPFVQHFVLAHSKENTKPLRYWWGGIHQRVMKYFYKWPVIRNTFPCYTWRHHIYGTNVWF